MTRMQELQKQHPEAWNAGSQGRLDDAETRPPEYLLKAGGDPSLMDLYYAWLGGFAEAG